MNFNTSNNLIDGKYIWLQILVEWCRVSGISGAEVLE